MKAFGAAEFAEADADGDGSLTLEELTARAKADRAKKMGKRAKRMLKRLDSDGNGTIELAEMEQMKLGRKGCSIAWMKTKMGLFPKKSLTP